jgi:dipeptidyl aminopeptidase/acylaminoacyl peptidase
VESRYARAARLTAPKVAAETPGLSCEGYWIDDERFFFLAERFDRSAGRLLATPAIAHRSTQHIEEVLSLDALAALLAYDAEATGDLQMLASAEFDMPDANTLAVSIDSKHFLIDWRARRVLRKEEALPMPASYSPDGRYVCGVSGQNLWLRDRRTGETRELTTDGSPHWCYGQQTETCSAAVSYRKQPAPMTLWSPDSQWLLTHRIDERSLPELNLIENAPQGGGRPVLHTYKYSMPGDPLPIATYVAIHVPSGRAVTFEECPAPVLLWSPLSFICRMAWFSGHATAWFVRADRYFRKIDLICLNLEHGTSRVVLTEAVEDGYIELHQFLGGAPNVRTLPASNEIVWYSERDGWGHLYLYDATTGTLKNRITRGEWLVRDIVHLDERRRTLLFTACGMDPNADPARRTLCSVHLDGSNLEVLLAQDGDVSLARTEPRGLGQDRPFRPSYAQPGVSPDGRWGVVLEASIERGNVTRMIELGTRQGLTITSAFPVVKERVPRHFTALAADGVTCLHGAMFLPSDFDESGSYPLIDYIYPGPQVSHKPQSFRAVNSAQASALAELGFITVMLDTRGMPYRSRAIHQAGYGSFLEPQLADHVAVVRQLSARHAFIDGSRAGIFGSSGGGYATARALFDYPAVFKVGVAICGNHDNRINIASWSEKYLGPLDAEKLGVQASSATARALEGKLLLVSGDMDENVHVGHTLKLADALVRANRDFDLLIVPGEGHAIPWTSGYALRRMWDYFVRHLLGASPPQNFQLAFAPHELARWEKNNLRELWQ